MKKICTGIAASAALITAPAFAADMAVKAPPAPPPVVATWTGFYIGLDIGGDWGRDRVSPLVPDGGVFPRSNTINPSGVFGGGTLGYNWQTGNFLLGLEGDVGYLGLNGSAADPGGGTEVDHIKGGVYGDVTGRLGVIFGPALLYGKGGSAAVDGRGTTTTQLAGFTWTSSSAFTNGWTAGGGLEYKISGPWSLKVEYLHFDFGTKNAMINGAGGPFPYSNKLTADSAKFGVNYQFSGPVH
jgi:outer membrane immunogenic protein